MTRGAASTAVSLLAALTVLTASTAGRAEEPSAAVDRLDKRLEDLRVRLDLVKDLVERGELSPVERARHRFNEAETQFLLENFEGCAALLLDALAVDGFRKDEAYPLALFYAGESLYQTQSYLDARRHLREAAGRLPPGRQQQDAIIRLIDLADKTGDLQDIDGFFDAAVRSGNVRPEMIYLYAKWVAGRSDLPFATRFARADADFARLEPGQVYHPQALYFRGALRVQAGQLEQSVPFFEEILALPSIEEPQRRRGRKVSAAVLRQEERQLEERSRRQRMHDLARLALARVSHDLGEVAKAVELYGEVSRKGPEYNDALYETAAAWLRLGDHDQALRTAETLLVIGGNTALAPEARILQANLLLRMGRYEKAEAVFDEVVREYAPVRDEIRAVIDRPEPAVYFDDLIARSSGALDLSTMLPLQARGFVDTNQEVEDARRLSGELHLGREGIESSRQLAEQMLDRLAGGNLETFPQLQEANSRAVLLSNALADLESEYVQLQVDLLADGLSEELTREIALLEAERQELAARFRQLPRTQAEYEQRRARFSTRTARLERENAGLGKQIEALRAQLSGLERYWRDTRMMKADAGERHEMSAAFSEFRTLLGQLEDTRSRTARELAAARDASEVMATGGDLEEELRARYRRHVGEMQAFVERMLPSVSGDVRTLLGRVGEGRRSIERLQDTLGGLRGKLRDKAVARAADYRRQIVSELTLLDEYQRQSDEMEGETRHLLGQIAYDSFARVERQFHDVVLKADVGIVDVAWTRKRERTDRIAELAGGKDEELRFLRERFREVLDDAD